MAGKYVRRAEKAVKKADKRTVIVVLILFAVGLAVGGFSAYSVSKNDEFSLIGEKNVVLTVGERYEDEGVKAVSFGKDVSDQVIKDDSAVDYSAAGEYYIVYRLKGDFKYGDYRLVRLVTVREAENG